MTLTLIMKQNSKKNTRKSIKKSQSKKLMKKWIQNERKIKYNKTFLSHY